MTAQEMDIVLSVELNKLNSTATRKYLVEEKQLYLNKAQDRFIASKVRKRVDSAFQYDIIDAEALDPIIVLGFELGYSEDNKITLPRDLQYFVRGSVKTNCGLIPINLLKGYNVDQVNQTPFFKSSKRKWNAELANNTITVYPHKNTVDVDSGLLTYIRKPRNIDIPSNVACELRDIFHQDIVDMAVVLMKTANASPDTQLRDQELKVNSVKLG